MGERVVVGRVPNGTGESPPPPPHAESRLNYADPELNPKFPFLHRAAAWARWAWAEVDTRLRPEAEKVVRRLGGRRQVAFGFGLSLIVGGLGAALGGEFAAFVMWVGGLLVGFSVRVPRG